MEKQKIRYDVINSHGKIENWSGLFDDEIKAKLWFEKYGVKHISEGHNLVKVIGEYIITDNKIFKSEDDFKFWLLNNCEKCKKSRCFMSTDIKSNNFGSKKIKIQSFEISTSDKCDYIKL